ncbi:MAG TPA: hypothetical protein VGX21_10610 [Methylomirabilota bacterium]|jgi:hypothetical protein|nr:hypothetical protein [Methylomirabilota bacterium]
MRQRRGFVFVAWVLVLLLAGCQKAIPLQSSFWQAKDARIAVSLTTLPDPDVYQEGRETEGLVALVVNEVLRSQMRTFLRKVELAEFEATAERFVQRLQQRGFTARHLERRVDLEQFPKFTGSGDAVLDRDVRSLAGTESADLVLLLSVDAWGTARKYVLGIPVGPHKGMVRARGRLVNLRTNQLQWQAFMTVEDSIVPVEGEWDQPPDYPNLTNAVRKAAEQAGQFLERQFFASGS